LICYFLQIVAENKAQYSGAERLNEIAVKLPCCVTYTSHAITHAILILSLVPIHKWLLMDGHKTILFNYGSQGKPEPHLRDIIKICA
jgi:hypothetical protein